VSIFVRGGFNRTEAIALTTGWMVPILVVSRRLGNRSGPEIGMWEVLFPRRHFRERRLWMVSVLPGQCKPTVGRMFNPTVGVCQSGRTERQADFDGLGSKENSPGMLGTSLSTLESIVPLKS